MIDENLMRAELSAAERAVQTARRKAIYEELHPETKREATLKKGNMTPSRQVGETGEVDRFTAETARKTGRSERAVQRDAGWQLSCSCWASVYHERSFNVRGSTNAVGKMMANCGQSD